MNFHTHCVLSSIASGCAVGGCFSYKNLELTFLLSSIKYYIL